MVLRIRAVGLMYVARAARGGERVRLLLSGMGTGEKHENSPSCRQSLVHRETALVVVRVSVRGERS